VEGRRVTVGDEDGPHGVRRWLEHLGLIVSIVPVFVASANLVALVRNDFNVLPAVLRGIDFVSVAFGAFFSIVEVIPFLVAYSLPILLRRRRYGRWRRIGVWLLVFLVAVSFFPLYVSLVSVSAALFGTLGAKVMDHDSQCTSVDSSEESSAPTPLLRSQRLLRAAMKYYLVYSLLLLIVIAPYLGNPAWMPVEEVRTKDGVHVGWVLESGDHDLTFLTSQDRQPMIIRQADIEKRTLCLLRKTEGFLPRWTLVGYLTGGAGNDASLPVCSEQGR
jgi:hypothetical protein